MLHGLMLAAQDNPQAAGLIFRGIKAIFVAIGSIIAAIVCAIIAGLKGRNPLGWGILGLFFSIITLTYVDNDTSAFRKRRRPKFEEMIQGLHNREFGAIIAWHSDRLYRRLTDLERLVEIADSGIHIRTVNGGDLDLSTSAGRMTARILGSVAQQESEHHSERRVRANMQKAEAGVWTAAHRPFGYTMKTGEPLEPEATMVVKAADAVLGGKSLHWVAGEWNAAGVQTTYGTTWTATKVRRVLLNPRYAGLSVHRGKSVATGKWKERRGQRGYGHAIAGGCVFAMSADMRLMSAGTIGLTELSVGVPFPVAALEICRHAMGTSATRAVLEGATVDVDMASIRGWIDAVVPDTDLIPRAIATARGLGKHSPPAYAATKKQLHRTARAAIDAGAETDATVRASWMVDETRTRITAFLDALARDR
jgi:DNA invertase Pin-like site-specific DNA recombinase